MYLGVTPLRRFCVFIIDIFLITLIASLILMGVLALIHYDNVRLNELTQSLLNNYVDIVYGRVSDQVMNDLREFYYLYLYREAVRQAITLVLYFLYLVVFQYFFKGQTIGRYLLRVKVVEDRNVEGKISFGRLILREIVGSYLFYNLLSILGFISMIFAAATGKSLVDRISGTSMVWNEKIPVSDDFKTEFFTNRQNDFTENEYTEGEYSNNDYSNDDYIDAEVKDVNDNNNENDIDDSDDEYRVI